MSNEGDLSVLAAVQLMGLNNLRWPRGVKYYNWQ